MQVVGILSPEFRHATLFSKNLSQRFAMLKALHRGLSRPMLAVALALQNDPTAETRLRNAFPYQRKLLRLASSLPNHQSRDVEKENDQSSEQRVSRLLAGPEYLTAAKRAINQLGETSGRR